MSIIVPRRITSTRGFRLRGLGAPTPTAMASQPMVDPTAAQLRFFSRMPTAHDATFMPLPPSVIGAASPPPPPVIDTTGEVVGETREPLPGDSGLPVEDPLPPQVQDLSYALVPRSSAWRVWLPIGVAVLGIGAAVLILRKS